MKQEKGITLIALVITIIVLLILAGVAISMLSGENGILNKAVEAKTKTENTSFIEKVRIASMAAMMDENSNIETELKNVGIDEENIISYGNNEYVVTNGTEKVIVNSNGNVENAEKVTDIDIELQTYFNEKGLSYKCKYGCITGFRFNWGVEETVEEFENNLPDGYEVNFRYNVGGDEDGCVDVSISEEEKSSMKITTGMSVRKNNETVARTVVFGDVMCEERIESDDASCIAIYSSYNAGGMKSMRELEDFRIMACDVNHDGEITYEDYNQIYDYIGEQIKIDQSKAVTKSKRYYKELQEYIARLDKDKDTGYTFEYDEENDEYKLKGVKADTTIKDLINALPADDRIGINGARKSKTIVTEDKRVTMTIKYYESYYDEDEEDYCVEERKVMIYFASIEVEK